MKALFSAPVLGAFIGSVLGMGAFLELRDPDHGFRAASMAASEGSFAPEDRRASRAEDPNGQERLAGPRPSVEDIVSAEGQKAVFLTVRYLREATMDEVLGLLERIEAGKRIELRSLSWLIYQKGVALDPGALVRWAGTQAASETKLSEIFTWWAGQDPAAALAASENQSENLRRHVERSVGATAPELVIAHLEKEGGDPRFLSALKFKRLENLARTSPTEALDEAMRFANPAERNRSLGVILTSWSKTDPKAALRWLEGQDEWLDEETPELDRSRLLTPILIALAETDPVLARQKLEAMPPSLDRNRAEARVVQAWGRTDPDGALDWVRDLPKSGRRDFLLGSIAPHLDLSPRAFLSLLHDLEADPYRADDLLSTRIQTEGSGWTYRGAPAPS